MPPKPPEPSKPKPKRKLPMTCRRIERRLQAMFERVTGHRCPTFEEGMVLTSDRGLTVRFGKQEFQITIVESRRG